MNRCRGLRRPLTAGSTTRHPAIGNRGWFRGAPQLPGTGPGTAAPRGRGRAPFPIESIHPELAHALGSEDEVIVGGEPFSPRLHIAMYQIVANQLLAGDPAETWQTVHRLAALGYDWRRK
jgi:hypothetical protein